MMYTTCVATVLWGVSAVLLIALQCPSPRRWDITNPQCMDLVRLAQLWTLSFVANRLQRAVRTYNAVMNIITDLALITVPTLMVLPLHIRSDTRLTLLIGFWCRIMYVNLSQQEASYELADESTRRVVVASVIQIGYIHTLTNTDLLNSIWKIVVCGQIVQVSSIMTATIPFLKPFLLSLESSLTLSQNSAPRTTTSAYNSVGCTGHVSSYIKIGTQHKQNSRGNGHSNIWVRTDFEVKGEPSMELLERKGN
jgi:hypothetical protein